MRFTATTLPLGRELRGPRLVARPFTEQDCTDLAPVLMDERVYAHGYVMHHRPTTMDEAVEMAHGWVNPNSLDGRGQGRLSYCFRLAEDCELGTAGTLVGSSSLGEVNLEREQLHLGWTIYAPAFWGQWHQCRGQVVAPAGGLRGMRDGPGEDPDGHPQHP
ncbi:GNAT family N-acetyltransferase [Luteococcus sp. OSA5]|uniref:GNAT family N-acetyltransferase n=1 Tax=Luteococcus sp. OSA5 TaxID=3401630 RepID=UPI003B433603